MRYFTFFKSFKPGAYFAFIAYLSLDSSSDILDLYLGFIKFIAERANPCTQVVPNILRSFQVSTFYIFINYNLI